MRKRLFRFPWRSRGDIERELNDELGHHLELRTAELQRRGMEHDAAQQEALRQFGDMEDARDYCRALALEHERALRRSFTVEAVVQDVAYMFRQMRRRPWFALGTITLLGVALGISVVCFVYVRSYLLRPLPVPAPDRLVVIIPTATRNFELPPPQGFNQLPWTDAYSNFETTVAWDLDGFTLVGGERSEYVDGAWVSAGFMKALTVRPVLGRPLTERDYGAGAHTDAQVALISFGLWQRRYGGDPNILGRVLVAHATDVPDRVINATIVGVLPEDLWHFNRFTDVILPLRSARFAAMAVLRPGDSPDAAAQRLTAWVRNQLPHADSRWRMLVVPAHEEYVTEIRPALRIALATCLLLLLVVCVNVAGLLLTQTIERRHELSVRSAIGAGRSRIVRQVVTECIVLAGSALVLSLVVAHLVLEAARPLVEAQLQTVVPGATTVDAYAAGFALLVAAVATLIFGLGPALVAAGTKVNIGSSSTRWSTGSRRGPGLRALFVAAQLAVCLALLGGSITLAQAARRLRAADLGFAAEGVLKGHVLLPQARYDEPEKQVQVVREILQHVGSVADGVAMVMPHPFRPAGTQAAMLPEASPDQAVQVTRFTIAGDYFGVMRIPILEGRAFDDRDRAGSLPVAAVSASLARRLWPTTSAVGQQLRIARPTNPLVTVVAVTGDVKKTLLDDNPPDVYLPFYQSPQLYMALLARGGEDDATLANAVQEAIWRIDRELPLSDVEMMTAVVAAETARHRFLSGLTSVIAGVALLLALIGLYATISYDVFQRRREFAIRSAVGARNAETYRLVFARGLRFLIAGVTAGAVLAAVVTRSLSDQIPAVQALGAGAQIAIAIGVISLALLALLGPARRATSFDPASLLRE